MKTSNLKHLIAPIVLPFYLCVLTGCPSNQHKEEDPFNGYYDNVDLTLEGEEFEASLRAAIMHETPLYYNSMQTYHKKTDKDPNNKDQILLYYSGESVESYLGSYGDGKEQIQREHVWPQSRFRVYGSMDGKYGQAANPGPATDIYNVRPCMGFVNEARSNYFYGEPANTQPTTLSPWDPKVAKEVSLNVGSDDNPRYQTFTFELAEQYRGDMARIIFYCAARYEKLNIIDANTDGTGSSSHTMGKLSDLLKWNLAYPASEAEKIRNDAGQALQGNRNPFVDHPEYACKIYGNTNAATKSICGIK